MHREKGKFGVVIVKGNAPHKSDAGWEKRQAKVREKAFANRTDAAIRTGATRRDK